jgi:predicted signal transduction protein with EAL and GGDEF domain
MARDYLAVRLGIAQYAVFAVLVVLVVVLPGANRSHEGVALACAALAIAYAAVQAVLPARPSLVRLFAFGSAAYIVNACIAMGATGGSQSPVRVLLIFSVVYAAWFYETRPAILILIAVMLANLSPMLYDPRAFDAEPLGTTIVLGTVLVMAGALMISGRLELGRLRDTARTEAKRDPLTDLTNRRALIRFLFAPGIDQAALRRLGERAVAAVQATDLRAFALDVQGVRLAASAGTAMYPDDAPNTDDLLRAADLAMRAGKGRVITAADDRATALADPSRSYARLGPSPR